MKKITCGNCEHWKEHEGGKGKVFGTCTVSVPFWVEEFEYNSFPRTIRYDEIGAKNCDFFHLKLKKD